MPRKTQIREKFPAAPTYSFNEAAARCRGKRLGAALMNAPGMQLQ